MPSTTGRNFNCGPTRAIKIDIKSEISAEVTEGLKENEQVVIRASAAQANTQSALSAREGP